MFKVSIEDNGAMQRLTALTARASEIPKQVFDDIGTILLESVFQNFEVGGRPESWIPSKRVQQFGGQTLVQSGALRDSGRVSAIGESFVEVSFGEGLPYAFIQQFGGTIQHPGSDKLQVWQEGGKTVFSHGTKPHSIEIPARRYVRIQDEDVEGIQRLLEQWIFNGTDSITITE